MPVYYNSDCKRADIEIDRLTAERDEKDKHIEGWRDTVLDGFRTMTGDPMELEECGGSYDNKELQEKFLENCSLVMDDIDNKNQRIEELETENERLKETLNMFIKYLEETNWVIWREK